MRHLIKASAAAAIVLTACSDSSGPAPASPTFDATGVSANVQTIRTVLDNNTWQSLRILGPRFSAAGRAAGLAGRVSAAVGGSAEGSAAASGVRVARTIMAGDASALLAPQLPAAVRGTTFVLDPATLQYVADAARTGAPANGVRFALYATDLFTKQPIPGQEIGHADLTDEGTATSAGIALRLRAVVAGITALDYRVGVTGTNSAGVLQAAGYALNGADRIDFQVELKGASASDTTAAQVVFAIGVPSKAFSTTATLQHVTLTGDSVASAAMTVRQGGSQVGLVASVTGAGLSAAFQVNGVAFATATGDPANPALAGADGRPLTAAEVAALVDIHRLAGHVLQMFDCLMKPVGGILGVGTTS